MKRFKDMNLEEMNDHLNKWEYIIIGGWAVIGFFISAMLLIMGLWSVALAYFVLVVSLVLQIHQKIQYRNLLRKSSRLNDKLMNMLREKNDRSDEKEAK